MFVLSTVARWHASLGDFVTAEGLLGGVESVQEKGFECDVRGAYRMIEMVRVLKAWDKREKQAGDVERDIKRGEGRRPGKWKDFFNENEGGVSKYGIVAGVDFTLGI